MANVDAPHGFAYLSMGRAHPPRTRYYDKLSTQGTAIFQQDVVHAIAGVAGHDKPPIEPFGTGTPGTTIPLGVAQDYGAASTATRHHVIIDTDAEYEAQDDGDTDGIPDTAAGLNANVSTGAGSTLTGYSGHEIDEAGINVSASRDLHLVGLFPDVNNATGSSHVRWIVKFNHLRMAENTVGV